MIRRPPRSTHFPSTTLVRVWQAASSEPAATPPTARARKRRRDSGAAGLSNRRRCSEAIDHPPNSSLLTQTNEDRKSTRLNSSHANISYAVFCLKKKYITILV